MSIEAFGQGQDKVESCGCLVRNAHRTGASSSNAMVVFDHVQCEDLKLPSPPMPFS
jgi:hypothetical protein